MKICSVAGCGNTGKLVRGWCTKHYARWQNHGHTKQTRRYNPSALCSVLGCKRGDELRHGLCSLHNQRMKNTGTTDPRCFPLVCSVVGCEKGGRITRGWCVMHYSRWQRNRNPYTLSTNHHLTPDERFDMKWTLDPDTECHCWTASIHNGYGQFSIEGKNTPAYRYAYERAYGLIPDGMFIDHLCHGWALEREECPGGSTCIHRRCVNPEHLRVVTQSQNNLENSVGFSAVNAAKTRCKQGHPFSGDNLYVDPGGARVCRTCRRAIDRARRPKYITIDGVAHGSEGQISEPEAARESS